jgi:HK97 family phage portal protein
MRIWGFDISRAKPAPQEQRNASVADAAGWFGMFPGSVAMSGMAVNRATALSIPAVWSAVNTVSATLASLPFDLYERTESGATAAVNHPLYYTTKFEPDEYVTGYTFRKALFADACFGNGYARVYRNGVGRATRFEKLDSALVLPFLSGNGQLRYRVTYGNTNPALHGQVYGSQEILFPWEIIHIKGLTLDGMLGEEITKIHKETFGVAIAATQYGSAFFGNGANLSGIIEAPGALKPMDLEKIRAAWDTKYAGVANTGRTAVLDGGMQYKKTGLTPDEAGLNNTRSFQIRETARIFGIPLHLFQDLGDTTFNNVETMSTQFVTLCLRPWAVQTEQEFAIKTLTDSEKRTGKYFYRLNLNGLLRGDTTARTTMYASGITNGWMTRNEARELEDLNIIEGLDKPLFPTNMTVLDENGLPELPQTDPAKATATADVQTDDTDEADTASAAN